MLGNAVLEEMDEAGVLDFAESRAEEIREAEVELLWAAYQWAVLHGPDRLDPAEVGRPGWEKARAYGGDGTPWVCEFAAAELGARIGRTTYAAASLMADALDLAHRGGDLWVRVQAGEVRASYARHVVAATRHLPAEHARAVATAVAEPADGRIPWTRFEALVAGEVAKADPAATRAEEERAAKARFAKKLRGHAHGMGTFMVRADLATIDQIDATVTALANTLAEELPPDSADCDDDRRVEAVRRLVMPQPTQETTVTDLEPVVHLYVHTYAPHPHAADREPASGVMRVEGHGPVTQDWVREVLGPKARFKIQPVLDLPGQAPVDAYEIPERHRQAVRMMSPADTFPFSPCTSRSMQVDHTVPHDQGGASGVGNYGPMTTPTTGSRPTADGRSANPSPASTSGATPTAPTTSSTTPAPDAYARPLTSMR